MMLYICFNKTLFKKGLSNVSKMAHFDIIITLKKHFYDILENIFLMFLKQYCVCWVFSHKIKAFLIPFKVKFLIKH